MSITTEQGLSIAQEVAQACKAGAAALESLEGPLSAFYADQVASDGESASIARSAIGALADSRGFVPVSNQVAAIERGDAGWSAERDGKRLGEWYTDYLENNDLFYYLGHLARAAADAGADELSEAAQAVVGARDAAVEAMKPLIGAYV